MANLQGQALSPAKACLSLPLLHSDGAEPENEEDSYRIARGVNIRRAFHGRDLDGLDFRSQLRRQGANAGHLECAQTCIQAGVKPVFVTDRGQFFKVANPEKVTDLAGQRVVLAGSEDNGTVAVKNAKAVPQPGSN